MKILLMTGPMRPQRGNNANLFWKLLPFIKEHNDVRLLTVAPAGESDLPAEIDGVPVTWCHRGKASMTERLTAKLKDAGGYSDTLIESAVQHSLATLQKTWKPDAVIATMEPFPLAHVAARSTIPKRVLYLMDPPSHLAGDENSAYRKKSLPQIVRGCSALFTTPFIKEALCADGLSAYADKMHAIGFPMVDAGTLPTEDAPAKSDRITLLFCGWLCSEIRSPRYFLDIVERLPESFRVVFMGRECEKLTERFPITTKAELVTYPQQPYEASLRAMAEADVLVNIGNNVPVHVPSKTLEYINTGKPILNLYKWDECPTLTYTHRYPLCLNIAEADEDVDEATARVVEFCKQTKEKTVPRDQIEQTFADCTPPYIADLILKEIGEAL